MAATPPASADDRGTVGYIDPALYTDVLQPGSGCALPVPAALCDATQDREITDDVFDRAFEMASEYNRELKDYSIVATAWLAKLQSEPPRALAMRMLREDLEAFLLEVTTFMSTTHEMLIDLPPEPIDYTELSCSWGSRVTRFREEFNIFKDDTALDSEEG